MYDNLYKVMTECRFMIYYIKLLFFHRDEKKVVLFGLNRSVEFLKTKMKEHFDKK